MKRYKSFRHCAVCRKQLSRWRIVTCKGECYREYRRRYDRAWRVANLERTRAIERKSYLKNKLSYRAYWRVQQQKMRALLLRTMPSWLSKEDEAKITDIYERAHQRTIKTGTMYHVDHIVPLQGKTVCGLHVPWNLRVIRDTKNRSKSNDLDEALLKRLAT